MKERGGHRAVGCGWIACALAATAAFGPATASAQPVKARTPDRSATPAAATATVPAAATANAPAAAAKEPRSGSAAMAAYYRALEARRLAAGAPLTPTAISETLLEAQEYSGAGRRDDMVALLVRLVENPRFADFQENEEGRAAVYALGDALASAGAYEPARAYLRRLLPISPDNTYARRAVRRLAEIALDTDSIEPVLEDLKAVPSQGLPEETQGEIGYLNGRSRQLAGDRDGALAQFAQVTQRSRFWAQAMYMSGILELERGRAKEAENLFCKVADPARGNRTTPFFADEKFFAVRDLSRLALGRVAHEQFRFDDSRYYYYLVPQDSDRLAEALFESATGRYEKKDYEGARTLLDELAALGVHHPYEDEAGILSAYVDLARCRFEDADAALRKFIERYEPVRDLARKLAGDDRALTAVLEAPVTSAGGAGSPADAAQTIVSLVRVDPGYGVLTRRLAELDRQMSGLRGATGQLSDLNRALATSGGVKPHAEGLAFEAGEDEGVARARTEADGVRRSLAALEQAHAPAGEIAGARSKLEEIDAALRARTPAQRKPGDAAHADEQDLPGLLRADQATAVELYGAARAARGKLVEARAAFAKDAVTRLGLRLSRLLRRARLGRIESVLGRKRALEIEVEALAAGVLPQAALDALEAPRYLRDDEEYWPFEGDDWPDEYVGAEGLR